MNKIFTIIVFLAFPLLASAHNKVVVIPLNADAPVRIYYGSVTGAGALETGNIDSASRQSTGVYNLDFGLPITGCAITVTKGSQGGGSSSNSGNINASVPSTGNIVSVRTFTSTFVASNTDFHFTAICP